MNNKIKIVRPIPVNAGIPLGVSDGKGYEQKFKSIPGTFAKYRLCRNPSTDRVELKLDTLVDNPYHADNNKEPKQITEQKLLEKQLGYKEGTLNINNIEFWDAFPVRLESDITSFNTDIPKHYLKTKVLDAIGMVLPSLSMKGTTGYEEAKFYFEDPEFEASLKEKEQDTKIRAYSEYNSLTPTEKKMFSRLLEILKNSDYSDKSVSTNLFTFIESGKLGRDKFLRLITKYKEDKEYIVIKNQVLEAEEKGLIKKISNRYYRMNPNGEKGTEVGLNPDMITEFYQDPRNEDLRSLLIEDLKNK